MCSPFSILFFILLLFFPIASCKIITTSYGGVTGLNFTSNGKETHVFMGIPQAEPPVGENRFKILGRPQKWNGVLNATEYRAACPSNSTRSSSPQKLIGEDCLYLNIFTSDYCLQSNGSCPVVVYLHGGQLSYDSAVMFNNTFILENYASKDIVFVIPSMRLGVLGLLFFENSTIVPRNLPIYDVELGLQFVNEEIHNFGGNNSKVTLMGHSTGGCLVYDLAYSLNTDPQAKLFQQMIIMSGPLFYSTQEKRLQNSKRILMEAGCLLPAEIDSFHCFKNLTESEILRAQRKAEEDGYELYGLTFDPPLGTRDEDFHARIEAAPKRNVLAGATTLEFYKKEDYSGIEVGRFLGLKNSEELKKKFIRDRKDENHPASKFLSYQSQEVFVPIYFYSAIQESKGADAWIYEFAHKIAHHSSDMPFFIGAHPRPMDADDEALKSIYIEMLTNFIKGNQPLPGWLKVNGTAANFMQFKSNISENIGPRMMSGYKQEEVNYWLTEMKDYDELITKQSFSTVALPLVIGLILFTIIFVATVVFCCRERQRTQETTPLLS